MSKDVKKTRLWGARLFRTVFPREKYPGIHETVLIGKGCKIDESVSIGPYSCIGNNVTIRENTEINNNVTITDGMVVGKNVIALTGAIIGSESLSFEINEKGEYEKIPQIKKVVIEDNVQLGPYSTTDKGLYRDTLIGKGSKIGGFVRVSHNDIIGKNCIINGHSQIGGSVIIEDNSTIFMRAVIKKWFEDRDWISCGNGISRN